MFESIKPSLSTFVAHLTFISCILYPLALELDATVSIKIIALFCTGILLLSSIRYDLCIFFNEVRDLLRDKRVSVVHDS